MKKALPLLLLVLAFFTACAQTPLTVSVSTEAVQIMTPTQMVSSTQPIIPTRKPTLTASPTRTRMPTITPGPTMTPFPTRTATFTPTLYDPANAVTRTPAPAAQCPVENPDVVPVFQRYDEVHYYDQEILEFLNMGASRQAVIDAFRLAYSGNEEWVMQVIQEKDVTGDGIAELLYKEDLIRAMLFVYRCSDGEYKLETALVEDFRWPALTILAIRDLNIDGVNEIVAVMGDDRTRFFYVLEWDGGGFQQLNWDGNIESSDYKSCMLMYGPSTMDFADTDSNGIYELILHQAIPIWSEYTDGLPWREETRTCTWNGTLFVMTNIEYASPQYRFQAVQDADRASLKQEYAKALDLYQQVIFNDQLDWWSEDRWNYEVRTAAGDTTITMPAPDPNEYFYLAAYARFRILLIHLLRGYLSDAETVYNTLQEKFPAGQPGAEFAEMAALFWSEYQTSSDIGLACAAVIQYISNYPDILMTYLGDYTHGWQSIKYKPEDVCPFTSTP